MHRSTLLACSLLLVACSGRSGAPRARDASVVAAAGPAAATDAPAADAAARDEVRAVPLTRAAFSEGDVARELGRAPDRGTACMDLGIFDSSSADPCEEGRLPDSPAPALRAPWASADVLATYPASAAGPGASGCAIVLVRDDTAYLTRDWIPHCHDGKRARAKVTWKLTDVVPGGAPELEVTVYRDEYEDDGATELIESTIFESFCGLGPSGVPACTPPEVVGRLDGQGRAMGETPPPHTPVFP